MEQGGRVAGPLAVQSDAPVEQILGRRFVQLAERFAFPRAADRCRAIGRFSVSMNLPYAETYEQRRKA